VVRGPSLSTSLLVVVVVRRADHGPVTGMLAGSIAGIVQDALSKRHGSASALAKSIVGFAAGVIGQQSSSRPRFPRFVMSWPRRSCTRRCSWGCTCCSVKDFRRRGRQWRARRCERAVGMIAFLIVEALPGAMERRKFSRRAKLEEGRA